MRSLAVITALVALVVFGCARAPTPTPTEAAMAVATIAPPATPTPAATPISPLATLAAIPTAVAPTVPPPPRASPTAEAGVLFLEVSEPQDGDEVTTGSVEVKGRTIVDAIVTVNDDLMEVDEKGSFSWVVNLEEGPNIIEVIASDFEGNEASVILAVIYSP